MHAEEDISVPLMRAKRISHVPRNRRQEIAWGRGFSPGDLRTALYLI